MTRMGFLSLLYTELVQVTPQLTTPKVEDFTTITAIQSVYDGDTFKVDFDCDVDVFCKNMSIRINGIDTPEIRGTKGKEREMALKAKAFTKKYLENAKNIELKNLDRGKYFRLVSDVYVDDQNLATLLMEAGLAKPYDGGKKPVWEFEEGGK